MGTVSKSGRRPWGTSQTKGVDQPYSPPRPNPDRPSEVSIPYPTLPYLGEWGPGEPTGEGVLLPLVIGGGGGNGLLDEDEEATGDIT